MKTNYKSMLTLRETEEAIALIKQSFASELAESLHLMSVSAPLFVRAGTGINDDLNGIERPVSFEPKQESGSRFEIVHSLAKWKRMALARYECKPGTGILTDMRAIRADEELDATHSLYVDQWDWECVMSEHDRTLDYLKKTVRQIYASLRKTELELHKQFPVLEPILPSDIYFIHAEQLLSLYPELSPKERENEICKKYGAVFVIGIGGELSDGKPHDGRAPDYDDWSTMTEDGYKGLNGDILVWHPLLESAFELSSMGIRVDKTALERQLMLRGAHDRCELHFHSLLLDDALPLSIGGGIGQSRLCMYLLRKIHIGEVQASVWPEAIVAHCKSCAIELL